MPPRRTSPSSSRLESYAHACDVTACPLPGEYRAPSSPRDLQKPIWLCLEHVRNYNKAWDYFDGMDAEQIEAFRKEAVTGHRPTWKISERISYTTEALEAGVRRFFGEEAHMAPAAPPVTAKQRKALAVLDLEPMPTLAELKKRYKFLVKRTHPDLNREDEKAEERFRQIAEAYKFLMQSLGKTL